MDIRSALAPVAWVTKLEEERLSGLVTDVEQAGREYWSDVAFETTRLSKKLVRRELKTLEKRVHALDQCVSALSQEALSVLGENAPREETIDQRLGARYRPPFTVFLSMTGTPRSTLLKLTEKLKGFQRELETVMARYSRPMSEQYLPREALVRSLTYIYSEAQERAPSRIYDWWRRREEGPFRDRGEKGPLREFVVACLGTIDPDALKGIDHVIRRAITVLRDPAAKDARKSP